MTWFGTGATLETSTKRPLLLASTFTLAQLSSRYFKRPFVELARKVTPSRKPAAPQLGSS